MKPFVLDPAIIVTFFVAANSCRVTGSLLFPNFINLSVNL